MATLGWIAARKYQLHYCPATALSSSSDVTISSPANNQALIYNSGTSKWTNQTLPSAAVTTVAGRTGNVVLAETDVTGLSTDLSSIQSDINMIDLGTDWTTGTRVSPFNDNPAARNQEIKIGTDASPDTTYGSAVQVSRTISIPESAFPGDGEGGLSAIRGITKALSSSEGQAIGVYGAGITYSSFAGTHSLADGIGVIGVGLAKAGTRTGMGGFFKRSA